MNPDWAEAMLKDNRTVSEDKRKAKNSNLAEYQCQRGFKKIKNK